jgi:ABC-type branched-subunit amino acid transport system ATPase component
MTTPSEPALVVHDLSVRYGGVQAVESLSLAIQPGQVVGLIGPNGAGKTSALDAITGFVTPITGCVQLGGVQVTGWPPHRRARAGLSRTFQQLELFVDLTVAENVELAADATGRGDRNSVDATLKLLGLVRNRDRLISDLPQGTRRLVALARAVASNPSVILLDEPAAGLDSRESDLLRRRVRDVAETGVAVLLVEHDMALVMNACDWLVVIEFGQTIGVGTPHEIRATPRIIEAYLGLESVTHNARD